MAEITRVGIDLAKTYFISTRLMKIKRRFGKASTVEAIGLKLLLNGNRSPAQLDFS